MLKVFLKTRERLGVHMFVHLIHRLPWYKRIEAWSNFQGRYNQHHISIVQHFTRLFCSMSVSMSWHQNFRYHENWETIFNIPTLPTPVLEPYDTFISYIFNLDILYFHLVSNPKNCLLWTIDKNCHKLQSKAANYMAITCFKGSL